MAAEEGLERFDGVIAQVLVVNRVEKSLLDHVDQVGDLEHKHAIRGQQVVDAFGHTSQIVRMGKHVIRSDKSRKAPLSPNLSGKFRSKERWKSLNARFCCLLRNLTR